MEKKSIPIKGMHCRSCEILIEEKLKKIPGLKGITVNYKTKQAQFFLNYPATTEQISNAIAEAGYEVGNDEKAWISKNPADYKDVAIAIVILAILYMVAKKFGILNINTGSNGSPSNLLVILVVGLTAGVSTCMALVGGLILGISARFSDKHPEASPIQKFRPHIFFNLGRILSYAILGGVIGLIGKAFQLSSPVLGILIILVGIVMIILGIQLTELFPKISSASFTLPASIAKLFGIKERHTKEYSHINSIITGALTFFLPCGFTQAMQLYAMSTGNFWSGAAIMGVFALGTAPGLLGIGGLTSIIHGSFAKKFFKFAGILVITLALVNIANGFNLTGWGGISLKKNSSVDISSLVKIENGVQIVEMAQDTYGYKPNQFTIRKGVPVKWTIDARDTNSCSSSILSPKLNIRKFLTPGENIIEFTPTELGEIKFSCSMGMYTGKFTVIESDQSGQPTSQSGNSSGDNTKNKIYISTEAPPNAQIIKANYIATNENSITDINPNEFTVSVGKPVRFEVFAELDGTGCMSSITIPKVVSTPQFLEKGKTAIFDFTPTEKGTLLITCAMGVVRGKIIVN